MGTMINRLRELKSDSELRDQVIERARTCAKGSNYVVVTKNLEVTVNNQDEHNVNFLVSFPPQCSEKKYYQTINEAIHQELLV